MIQGFVDSLEADPSPNLPGSDVIEVPLLLQGWQMTALETAAHDRGQTAAEMVRTLLRDFISHLPPHAQTTRLHDHF